MTTIAAIAASVATIVGGGVWLMKYLSYKVAQSQDQQDQTIINQNAADKNAAKETGRPV